MSDFGDWGFQGPTKRSLDLPSGPNETVSTPGRARLRFNSSTGFVEVSVDTSPYAEVLVAGHALASQIINDSGVAGGTVADALDVLKGEEGITPADHDALRQLIHFIDDGPTDGFASGSVKDCTTEGTLVVNEVWYTDAGRTQKIVELDITYNGVFPVTETWRMYDTDGTTVLVTLVDTIQYNGVFEASRTRTYS